MMLFKKYNWYEEQFNILVENVDTSLPPCESELCDEIKKAAYILELWKNAHSFVST